MEESAHKHRVYFVRDVLERLCSLLVFPPSLWQFIYFRKYSSRSSLEWEGDMFSLRSSVADPEGSKNWPSVISDTDFFLTLQFWLHVCKWVIFASNIFWNSHPKFLFSALHSTEDINNISSLSSGFFFFFFLSLSLHESHGDISSYPLPPFLKGLEGTGNKKRAALILPIPLVSTGGERRLTVKILNQTWLLKFSLRI